MPEFNSRVPENISIENVIITEEIVMKKLKSLDIEKSQGPDGLHPRMLKELACVIVPPLSYLFKRSVHEGIVPDRWKLANVTPIHKNGSKNNKKNYRPISLTSVLCKILESIIKENIMDYFSAHNLFTIEQHGFISGKSCTTQLLETQETLIGNLDNHAATDVVYFDLRKAFDSVPHQRLKTKLRGYGIRGPLLNWIVNYLKDRKQRVVMDGATSDWCSVSSGVPQGSVLGPLLFLIYVNDLPDKLKSNIKLYADDAKLYREIKSVEDCQILQNDILEMEEWANIWQLTFNPLKCQVLKIGKTYHPDININYYMHQSENVISELENVLKIKDLGVVTDENLVYKDHIESVTAKANKMWGIIRRTFTNLDKNGLLVLYKTMVRSHLEFAAPVWSPHYWYQVEALETVQRRATKMMPGLKDVDYENRLKELDLPSLVYRRIRGDVILFYRSVKEEIILNLDAIEFDRSANTRGNDLKLIKKTMQYR